MSQCDPSAGPPPTGRRRLARAVAVCGWAYLGTALACWALLSVADLWWPATLLMFSPRWLLTLPSLVLLPAAALWRRRSLGPVLAALVVAAGPVTGLCLPWRPLLDPPRGQRLRLLTCNLHYRPGPPGRLDRLVAETEPDVVVLQEWDESNPSALLTGGGWHTHRVPHLFLASRYPIRRAEDLRVASPGEEGAACRYELETPAGTVTLFNLHLTTPRDGLVQAARSRGAGAAALEDNSALRWGQSGDVARQAEAVAGPLLLAGDFNTPPESAIFRRVWGRYADAFSEAGWGWGYTFFGGRTSVRIDHVLAGPGWRVGACRVCPDVGSPHRPVLADLFWTAGAPSK